MESSRRYMIVGAKEKEKEDYVSEDGSKSSVSSARSDKGNTTPVGNVSGVRPWRTTQDVPRACLDVVIAGLGYLL